MENTITISVEEYKNLLAAAHDCEMLKAMICEKAETYQKLENSELRLLKELFGCKESEE